MNKIVNFLFVNKFDPKIHYFLIPLYTTISAMLLVPLKVTVDGTLYLSSARALFGDKMGTHYYWIREPIYPLILRIIKSVYGNSDLGLIFIQGSLLGTSIVLCIYSLSLLIKLEKFNLVFLMAVYFFILNPYILGMTGLVLQQVIFTFYLSVSSLILAFSYNSKFKIFPFILLILIYIIAVLTSVSFLPIFIPIFLTYFFLISRNNNFFISFFRNQILKKFRNIILSLVPTVVFYVIGFLILRVWSHYKDINSSKSTLPTELFTAEQVSETIIEATTSLSLFSLLAEEGIRYIKNFLSLFHFVTSEAFPFFELTIYTNFQFYPDFICGAYDAFDEQPYSNFGFGYFAGNCRSEFLNSLVYPNLRYFEFFYTLLMTFFIASTLIFLLTRMRFVALVLVPQYSLIFAYTLADAGLDRYGYSIISMAIGLLVSINLVKHDRKIVLRHQPT